MDWLGVTLNLIGWWIIPRSNRRAAYVFLAGNAVWIAWAVAHQVWSIVALQIVFVALNVRMIRLDRGG